MIAIQDIEYTRNLRSFGQSLTSLDAILVISAHWLTNGIFVSGSEFPETIYDFYGFPEELYRLNYPCPGSPVIAQLLQNTLSDLDVKIVDRGLDHGAWQVLRSILPDAGVPTIQLSIHAGMTFRDHYELAQRLQFLRDKNIAIMGSGNIVHNLSILDWENQFAKPLSWAKEFHDLVKSHLETGNVEDLIDIERVGESYRISAPTPEHYIPLLYAMGAKTEFEKVKIITDEFHHATISMLSFCFR